MSGRWSWWDTWRQDLDNCRVSVEDAFGCIGAHRNDIRSINGRLDALQTQLSGLETAFSEIRNNQEVLKLHLERLVVLSTMWCDEQIESLQSDAYIRDVQLNRLQCSCVHLGTVQQELGDDRAESVEKGTLLVQKVLMHQMSIPALNKWTTVAPCASLVAAQQHFCEVLPDALQACFGNRQEVSEESEVDEGVALGQPVDQTARWRKLARKRQQKASIFMKEPESRFRTLAWTVLTAPIMRIHFSLFKHATWFTERPKDDERNGGQGEDTSSAFGMVAARPTQRALSQLAQMVRCPDNDAWMPLVTFYGPVLQWPQARLRTTRRAVCTIVGQLWRKLAEPWQRHPWKLLGLLSDDDDARRACAQELLDCKCCCLDNFSEKLRGICPSLEELLSEDTRSFVEAVFNRVVPTSTYVERLFARYQKWTSTRGHKLTCSQLAAKHYTYAMTHLVGLWRKNRVREGAWSVLPAQEQARWKQKARVQNAAARARQQEERLQEAAGDENNFSGGPWGIGSEEGFPLARHVVVDSMDRKRTMEQAFAGRTQQLQPENLDSFLGAVDSDDQNLFATCGSQVCFNSLPAGLQAGLRGFHGLLLHTIMKQAPLPLAMAEEPLVMAFASNAADCTEYAVVAYHTRKSPIEAALLRLEVATEEGLPEDVSLILKMTSSQDGQLHFSSNQSWCFKLFQRATDWVLYVLSVGQVRKLWQFDITGSERVDEDKTRRDMAAASEASRVMQAMRVLQKRPQPRKRAAPDLVPRPGKKQRPKAQQEKVAEAAAAAPGKHQDHQMAEVEEEVDDESNDASSQSDAEQVFSAFAMGEALEAPPVVSTEAPAVRQDSVTTGRHNVKRATIWGRKPAFQIAPIYSEGVHTGWRAFCGRHTDATGRALPCQKTVNNGSGLSDGECVLRLKRWLVAGFQDQDWGGNKRSFHLSQGGWQLGAYSAGLSEQELDALVLGPWAMVPASFEYRALGRSWTEASHLAKARDDCSSLVLDRVPKLLSACWVVVQSVSRLAHHPARRFPAALSFNLGGIFSLTTLPPLMTCMNSKDLDEFLDAREATDVQEEEGASEALPERVAATDSELGGRPSSSTGSVTKLRVEYNLAKSCTCCLCNAKSTDTSPLDGWEGDEDRLLDGRLPWSKYGKRAMPDGEVVRVPEGRLDLICLNVFRALGAAWPSALRLRSTIVDFLKSQADLGIQDCQRAVRFLEEREMREAERLAAEALARHSLRLAAVAASDGQPFDPRLQAEYGSYSNYFKEVVKKENQTKHQKFLNGRKVWIQQHGDTQGRTKLKNKKDLLAATKELTIERKIAGSFEKPEKAFVTPEGWNPSIHGGEYDKTKEVEEDVFGKIVKGVWVNTGPVGVFKFKEFDQKAIRETDTEHSAEDQLFAEEAFERKKKAAFDVVETASKARDNVAVKGKEMSMASLLQSIQASSGAGSSSDPKRGGGSSDGEDSAPGAGNDGAVESSSEEEEAGPSAAHKMFGKVSSAKAKATPAAASGQDKSSEPSKSNKKAATAAAGKAKPKAQEARKAATVNTTPRAKPGSAKQEGKGSVGPMFSLGSEKASDPVTSPAKAGDMLLVDGRAKRAYNSMTEKADEGSGMLEKMDLSDAVPAAHERAEWKASLAKRAAQCKLIVRQCKDHLRRMDKSANKESFSEPLQRLELVSTTAQTFDALLSVAGGDPPEAEKMVEAYENAFEACQNLLFKPAKALGPVFSLKYILAKGNLACLYQEYDQFCSMLLWKRDKLDQMESLSKALGRDKLQQHITAECENRLTMLMRLASPQDLRAFGSSKLEGSLLDASTLCESMLTAGTKEGDNFILAELSADVQMTHAILTLGSKDLSLLSTAVAKLQEVQAALETKEDAADGEDLETEVSALPRFFAQHNIGKALLDMACGRVLASAKEKEAQAALKEFEKATSDMKACRPHQKFLEEFLQPALAKYQEVQKLCQELKKKGDQKFLTQRNLLEVGEQLQKELDEATEEFISVVEKASIVYLRAECLPLVCLVEHWSCGSRIWAQV
ncbi:unnamed protein product [Symbiodinium sp. CCMP2592]|nr:unnamed protein product [Symbiodinium sp. CCMP2592]